jgi:uncharacterized membrane protein YjgN (DUF898 family)
MFTIIGSDGKEYGPVTGDQIKQWMTENRLTRDMQAKRVGASDWRRIGDLPEFAGVQSGPEFQTSAGPANWSAGEQTSAAPSAAATALAAAPSAPERIVFTGEWTEYFKIWIVNVLLTIVTLGIYAAWAKVRKRRYFYANTRLFGHTFEYLADPVKILYGNLIVGGMFLLLTVSQTLSPLLYLCFALAFAIAVPFLIVRALAFNARNTAWRGLRFNFTGRYGESAAVFLGWPMLIPFTLGLIFPLIAQKQKEFIVNHHAYGTSPFSFGARAEGFYKIYGIAVLFFLPLIVIYFVFIAMMVGAAVKNGQPPGDNVGMLGSMGLLFLFALPFALAGTFYFRSRMFNYIWNNTSLAGNQFVATMRARDLFVLHLVNSIVTLVTIGLMHPWAAVRTTKYQLDCLQVVPAGNIDAFVAAAQPPVGAFGEAANDFFDFDLGFGL